MNGPGGGSWIAAQLSNIPAQADAALMPRHAEREDIPPGTFGVNVPLTPRGVALDWRLGAPGPFVVDEAVSGALFLEIGLLETVKRQLTQVEPPAGMRATGEGIELLLGLAASDLRRRRHLNIYVTHDAILAVLGAYLYGLTVDEVGWPGYLDGLLLWRCGQRLRFSWRGLEQGTRPLGG